MMRVSKLRKLSLTVGLAVLMAAAVPSAQMTPAEAAWSATDAKYHFYKTPSDNQRLFIMAVKQGDCDTVKSMLAAGVDVNGVYAESVSHAGYTGLWWAIRNDKREVAQLLLENKADVNGYYEYGQGAAGIEQHTYVAEWHVQCPDAGAAGTQDAAAQCVSHVSKQREEILGFVQGTDETGRCAS